MAAVVISHVCSKSHIVGIWCLYTLVSSSCCSFWPLVFPVFIPHVTMMLNSFALIVCLKNHSCLFIECHLCPKSLSGCHRSREEQHTLGHVDTPRTCLVEQMVYRALLCPCVWLLCSWSAVGSPLITLIWLGTHSYLIRQLFFMSGHKAERTFNLAGSTENTCWYTQTSGTAFDYVRSHAC